MSEASFELDPRLREIDTQLRTIQAELEPAVAPAGVEGQSPRPPAPTVANGEPQMKLVSSMHELLDAYQLMLTQNRAARVVPVAVAAGPFAATNDLREFERALAAIPHVEGVSVRAYEAENRVLFDVQLSGRSA